MEHTQRGSTLSHSPGLLAFKHRWLDSAESALNSTVERQELDAMFESRLQKSIIEVENTFTSKVSKIDSASFFLGAKSQFIMNESGMLTTRHDKSVSKIGKVIVDAVKVRKAKKKEKIQAYLSGDTTLFKQLADLELNLKIIVNAFYGIYLYTKSAVFNASCAAACTSAGRNVIAVSCITVEQSNSNSKLAYRSYTLDAYVQSINNAIEHSKHLCETYTLPTVSVEETLEHLLGHYYDETFYGTTYLRHKLSLLTPGELSVCYIRNNIPAFIRIPEVHSLIVDILTSNKEEVVFNESDMTEEDIAYKNKLLSDVSIVNKMFGDQTADTLVDYMYNNKSKKYADASNKLKFMSGELVMGFFFYNGDYVDGLYCETVEDIVDVMPRHKVIGMDTDSNITSVFAENLLINDVFAPYIESDFVRNVVCTVIATTIFTGQIDYSLHRYSSKIGVGDSYLKYINMEEETTSYSTLNTGAKKRYIYDKWVQDGILVKEPYTSITTKGLNHIKSDTNPILAEMTSDVVTNNLMGRLENMDYLGLFAAIDTNVNSFINIMKSKEFVLTGSTIAQSNKHYVNRSYGDSKNKALRLWSMLDVPDADKIEFPGNYRDVKVHITPELMNSYRDNFPNIYNGLIAFVGEMRRYNFCKAVIRGIEKVLEKNPATIKVMDAVLKRGKVSRFEGRITDASRHIRVHKFSADVYSDECLKYITDLVYGKTDSSIKTAEDEAELSAAWRRISGLSGKDFILTASIKEVCESVTNLGIPVSLQDVPEFISHNDFSIISKEFVKELPNLLAPLVSSIGIVCPRNKNGDSVISSIMSTY